MSRNHGISTTVLFSGAIGYYASFCSKSSFHLFMYLLLTGLDLAESLYINLMAMVTVISEVAQTTQSKLACYYDIIIT